MYLLLAQQPLSDFQRRGGCDGKAASGPDTRCERPQQDDGEEHAEDDGNSRWRSRDVPKIRILELRAQGMAEAVAEAMAWSVT